MPAAGAGGERGREWVAAPAAARLADLHDAIADPAVDCVMWAIGGDHSAELLDGLDLDLLRSRPTLLCGYSDATVLLHAVHARTGLVGLYAPAYLPQFGEIGGPDAEVVHWFLRSACEPRAPGALPVVDWQADEPRAAGDEAGRPRHRHPGQKRRVLRDGVGEGPLLPACLPSLRHLVGTPWQPRLDGGVLVLECPGDGYAVRRADADLTHLRNCGLLRGLAGLGLGRCDGWSSAEVDVWHRLVLAAVDDGRFPVLAGLECSHAGPTLTLPIGVLGRIAGAEIEVLEPAVSDPLSPTAHPTDRGRGPG